MVTVSSRPIPKSRQGVYRRAPTPKSAIGRRAPIPPHPERAAVPEVEAVRGDVILCPHAMPGNVLPGKAERLPAARVHLAMEQGQPLPPVQRLGLNAQTVEVAHHIGLHTLQPGPGLGHTLGGQATLIRALSVAACNLVFQHGGKRPTRELVWRRIFTFVTAAVTDRVDKGELDRWSCQNS